MKPRINLMNVNPGILQAILGLEKQVSKAGLDHKLLDLVRMRASQINGCAYCLDMHSKDARAAGETEQRLYGLNAWRETPYYSARERAALDWIRRETPPDAVIQLEPYTQGSSHWAYLPAFAERRTGAGRPGSMIPIRRYANASDNVLWGIYRAVSAKEAHVMARFLKIDYVAATPLEREAFKPGLAQIAASPELFAPVFENPAMTIYRVEK